MDKVEKKALVAKVVEGIIDFKIIPFIGAGLSTDFGMKDWEGLVDDLKTECGTSESNFLKVAQAYEDALGRDKLISKLTDYYTIGDISRFDVSLHELLLAMSPPIIYTTNYDTAIEDVAELIHRSYYKIACLKDIVLCPHKANVIVKFHGDFSAPQEIILTDNDYAERMKLENPLDVRLRSDLIGKGLLFIAYSLRDININFILRKHATQYGKDNLPKHYLITFDKNITVDLKNDLEKKNIEVIAIESPAELYELIKSINEDVFHGSFKREFADIYKSKPGKVLLKNELDNLKVFWNDTAHSDEEKAKRINEVIAWKTIPEPVEEELLEFYKSVVYVNGMIKSKEAALISFTHLSMKTTTYAQIAMELMELTSYEELNWGMTSTISLTDVISDIELVLKREPTLLIIFLFLHKCYEQRRVLSMEQADRIFYALSHYRYEEIDRDYDPAMPKEHRNFLINHFLNQQPGVIRNRFNSPLLSSRGTGSEMAALFLNMFPKD